MTPRAPYKLFALAYNLANLLRSLALPREVARWTLTTLREKLVKIGARIVRHGRYLVSRLAEVAVPRAVFAATLRRVDRLRGPPVAAAWRERAMRQAEPREGPCPDEGSAARKPTTGHAPAVPTAREPLSGEGRRPTEGRRGEKTHRQDLDPVPMVSQPSASGEYRSKCASVIGRDIA